MVADASPLRNYAGRPVLVFGATGFIGRAVARLLAAHGARLTLAVRDCDSGEALASSMSGETRVMACDVLDHERVADVLADTRPSVSFNLAGYGVDRTERDEVMARRVNAEFPAALCAAVSSSTEPGWAGARIVHAGTQLEYGPQRSIQEDVEPAPDTLYGVTKLAGTQAIAACARERGLPAVTARLFTVYGPGEPAGRLLPSLIDAATTHTPMDMTAGDQVTDFVHIDDVAEGLLRLGLASVEPGEAINLASGRLTSVRSFALEAARILGMPQEQLRFGALPQRAETMRYENVIPERLHQRTGWTPPTTVAEGIRRTVQRHGLTHASE